MKKKYLIVFFIIPFSSFFCDTLDRELENAYRALFAKEFGYTLIGEKPASIEEGIENEYLYTHPHALKKFLGSLQETFKNSKRHILKIFAEDTFYWIEIINRDSIKKVLKNNNLKEFIEKKFKTENEFYKKLEDPKIKIFDILDNDAYLKGIVLGYGDSNARYFCRRCEIGKYLNKYLRIFPPDGTSRRFRKIRRPYKIKEVTPSPGFSSLEAEWQWIKKVEWSLNEEREVKPPYFIALPFYICRHGGDSEIVRENYKRARVRLTNLLCNRSFQEAIAQEAAK